MHSEHPVAPMNLDLELSVECVVTLETSWKENYPWIGGEREQLNLFQGSIKIAEHRLPRKIRPLSRKLI